MPAARLAGVNCTRTRAWSVTYGSIVANLEMHGKGHSSTPAKNAAQYPSPPSGVPRPPRRRQDTQSWAALQFYQMEFTPDSPQGTSTRRATKDKRFQRPPGAHGHVPPLFTSRMEHAHAGGDRNRRFPGHRSPDKRYARPRFARLLAPKGGFYHDGRSPRWTWSSIIKQNLGLKITDARRNLGVLSRCELNERVVGDASSRARSLARGRRCPRARRDEHRVATRTSGSVMSRRRW